MIKLIAALFFVVPLLTSCSDSDESLANKAGDKVGQVLTDFAGGMGKGIDKQMLISVELSDKVAEKGLAMTVAKQDSLAEKQIVLYLIATKPFDGKLLAKAMNVEGLEIGRSSAEVKLAKDEAKYISFAFHQEMDTQLVKVYSVDVL